MSRMLSGFRGVQFKHLTYRNPFSHRNTPDFGGITDICRVSHFILIHYTMYTLLIEILKSYLLCSVLFKLPAPGSIPEARRRNDSVLYPYIGVINTSSFCITVIDPLINQGSRGYQTIGTCHPHAYCKGVTHGWTSRGLQGYNKELGNHDSPPAPGALEFRSSRSS